MAPRHARLRRARVACGLVAAMLPILAGCGSGGGNALRTTSPVRPNRAFGVFVGIAEYPITLTDLAGCDQDAVQVWTGLGGSLPPWPQGSAAAQQIRLLTCPTGAAGTRLPDGARGEASRERILQAIADLAGRMTPNDLLVFYFSGHAEYDAQEGRGYLYSSGAHEDRISDAELAQALAAVPANARAANVVVVVDACQSGAFAAMADTRPGIEVLASSAASEEAVVRGAYSIFTSALLQGLGRENIIGPADRDGDKMITPSELFQHARWGTQQMTPSQHPVFRGPGGLREMALKCGAP